ncbi:response regulator [Corallococcus llansteffanensis]|uniref:Response regulator n=1 Tax=Corallococcus llansteffanensis TaxID=2316731 RepID=A0A3A8QGD8_9BACT|nr:response regulator [Corallococcus llansteffanensis]RKH65365.1 response regulator [Corallococcus llansteffanensis]
MKVLLVEDDASLREGMGELVSELADVQAVGTIDEALRALETGRFELVMTDLRIAGGHNDGRSILEAARRRLHPVVVVSAAGPDEVAEALHPLEPDGLLIKPFQVDDIMGLVERFLELKRQALAASESPLPEGSPDWTDLAPGARTATARTEAPRTWVRLTPEADFQWRRPACAEGLQLLEGSLELDGEGYAAPCYLFLAVGASPRVKTRTGAVAVCVPLRG